MIEADTLMLPPEAAAEARSWLRALPGDEEALIATLVQGAAELCERFTGLVLIAREVREVLRPGEGWTRLGRTPVRAIAGIAAAGADGVASPLPADAFAVDIDGNGDGWVRVSAPKLRPLVKVTYSAGLAAGWETVPDALRHGIVRLASHLYTFRTGPEPGSGGRGSEPPASVTALWRPYRRMRLR